MNENTDDIKIEQYDECYFSVRRKILVFFFIFLAALIIFYFAATIFITRGYREAMYAAYYNSLDVDAYPDNTTMIIIDPGHGGEDSGAQANNLNEKDINLSVSKKLAQFLSLSGYTVYLTRTEDVLLYEQGQESKKKYYDLRNRLAIAENNNNCIFVSIHMNKFPLTSSKGLQVFYSSNNNLSMTLAESIQNYSKLLNPDNKRKIKRPELNTIFLLEEIKKPAVLVECGFLSNPSDAALLNNEEYQCKLAFVIYGGIVNFLSEIDLNENHLSTD